MSIALYLGIWPSFLIGQAAERAFENLLFFSRCPIGHPAESHDVATVLTFHGHCMNIQHVIIVAANTVSVNH
jgi:hypothetical protein